MWGSFYHDYILPRFVKMLQYFSFIITSPFPPISMMFEAISVHYGQDASYMKQSAGIDFLFFLVGITQLIYLATLAEEGVFSTGFILRIHEQGYFYLQNISLMEYMQKFHSSM